MASARYLVERGVQPSRVLLESWSLDTIGELRRQLPMKRSRPDAIADTRTSRPHVR